MKNIITIIATVLFSTVVMSQETPSISIVGEASYNVEKIKNYVIHIQLKDVKSDGYSTFENKTLEQIKADYKNKLSTIGVDFNKFSENKGLYIYSGYSDIYNETVYYTYVTTSEADIINVVKAKISGLTIMNVEINAEPFSSEKISELAALATKNAEEKAEKVAKKLNKKLGKIISVTDANYSIPTYSYYGSQNYTYVVNIKFELL